MKIEIKVGNKIATYGGINQDQINS